jgi:hypothetical protein
LDSDEWPYLVICRGYDGGIHGIQGRPSELNKMRKESAPQSMAAYLDRKKGSVLQSGTVSHIAKPIMVDPLRVMIGAGCGEWGLCLYLTITDAAELNARLSRLLSEHAEQG